MNSMNECLKDFLWNSKPILQPKIVKEESEKILYKKVSQKSKNLKGLNS